MFYLQKTLCNFTKQPILTTVPNILGMVSSRKKHYNPKFKWLRGKKFISIDLPDFQEKPSREKMRTRLKELGVLPPRFWKRRPMTITTTSTIINPYEPPVGDGKSSIIPKNAKDIVDKVKEQKDYILAKKQIINYDSNFSTKVFPQEAHDIYVKAHTVLMKNDPEELSEYVTESAIMQMMSGIKHRTLRWKFIESLEPPKIVQISVAPVIQDSNLFGQITVRFHTKQMLAIYDRFGRLFYGSETIAKDVLEYVVFEKHIVNEYGTWRLHAKIIPEWMPSREGITKTTVVEKIEESDEDIEDDETLYEDDYKSYAEEDTSQKVPQTQATVQ